jgi:hypothetical protein
MPSRLLRHPWLLGAVSVGLISACFVAASAQVAKPAQGAPVRPAPKAPQSASSPKAGAPDQSGSATTQPSKPSSSASAAVEPGGANKANATSPLGTNLDGVNDWSPEYAFVDAMKRSREWISATPDTWEDKRKFTLDPSGWVRSLKKGQLARSLVFWDAPHYPGGDYIALYDGTAELKFDVAGGVKDKRPGRELVHVDASKGNLSFLITSIPKPGSYPKNMRLIMPGGVCDNDPVRHCDTDKPCAGGATCTPFEKNHETQIFHPSFLDRIKQFSTLRFMDWMRTNDSKERKWKDRPLPSDVRWRDGVPLEIMVALANRMAQNPWFNIPHAADDDYVRRFATYVRDNLRPDLKVYVEYSNEVWNGMFPQAAYATQQGKKLRLGTSDWDAQYRFYAKRTTQVHKIWESVFKGQQKRVVRVLGTQVANAGVANAYLEYGDTKDHVDALAVAPYFGGEYASPEEASKWENASVTDVINDLRKRSLPASFEQVKVAAETAAKYNLELVAYEGGESFAGVGGTENNDKLNKLLDAIGRDPRMKQIYVEYLDNWKKAGGKLFVHFTSCYTPSKWGRWGALEWQDQPRAQAPKFDGLMTFIENNPRWW